MAKYRYIGPGVHHIDGNERTLTPGDVIEREEDDISFPEKYERVEESKSDDKQGSTSSNTESSENASADDTEDVSIDPAEYSVPDLEAELTDREPSEGELRAILEAEKDGKDRTTAKRAIEGFL